MSNVNNPNGSSASGGVAKRRKGGAPQRPFVVASKSGPATANVKPATSTAQRTPPGASSPKTATRAPITATATATKPASLPGTRSTTTSSAALAGAEHAQGSLLRVTGYALTRYLRNPWFAVDVVLLAAVFAFCFRSSFSTINFFTTAAFLFGTLSAVGAYGLVHSVVPPEDSLSLVRAHGAARSVGGLALAAIVLRTAYCLIFVGLALAFNRFDTVQTGPLLAGLLGLIVACAVIATLIVCLSSPFSPRAPRVVALGLLMLGFASFDATGLLGDVLFIARILLFPFIAPYRLAVAPTDLLAWLGTVLLAPAAIVGMILLSAFWLRQIFAGESSEMVANPA